MKFDDLDAAMRVFETAHDHCVLPGIHMVARLDGRSFTLLTKKQGEFEAPFDVRFRDLMVETSRHLMTESGLRFVYGYTESDEISLLIDVDDQTFGRKLRKLHSVLAGEASAKFTSLLGRVAVFDCRICQLPRPDQVIDYFRWRNEDAHRNALNAHCYWHLRKQGLARKAATAEVSGKSVAAKNELLFQAGINFNELPAWQRRGVGLVWDIVKKEGYNPRTGEVTIVQRRELRVRYELPMKEEYSRFIQGMLPNSK